MFAEKFLHAGVKRVCISVITYNNNINLYIIGG